MLSRAKFYPVILSWIECFAALHDPSGRNTKRGKSTLILPFRDFLCVKWVM